MMKLKYFSLITLLLVLSLLPIKLMAYHYTYFKKDLFTTVHVLTVDPNEHTIALARANGPKRRETVAKLAKANGAVAAINGGFWKENGSPAGILKVNGTWQGLAIKPRAAIGWSEGGKRVFIDRLLTKYHSNQDFEGSFVEIIPQCNLLDSAAKEWEGLENIVGGAPLLVFNGQLITDYSQEQTTSAFLMKKKARTAVGITQEGTWIFVVVDTKFFGFLGGMCMKELAKLMQDLGSFNAINLDGGSSSTMVIRGYAINSSYGYIRENSKYVQAVSDAIIILY